MYSKCQYVLTVRTDKKPIIKITDDIKSAIADISKNYKIREIVSIETLSPVCN